MKPLVLPTIALVLLAAANCLAADPEDVSSLSPQQVEKKALEHLAAGRQARAEHLLEAYLARFPGLLRIIAARAREFKPPEVLKPEVRPFRDQQRPLFVLAACTRSRFAVEEAMPMFVVVNNMDPDTPAGKCAAMVAILDGNQSKKTLKKTWDLSKVFAILMKFPDEHPDDVVIRWMAAVQCRQAKVNEEGAEHYRKIREKWDPGPVLVHQTYANMLDELKRYAEALPERQKAVEMEPAGWSYDGLANTLHHLRRFKEANETHAKATALGPEHPSYFCNWACTLRDEGRLAEAIVKCQRAIELDPKNWRPWWVWGQCLERQGKKAEAIEKYEGAMVAEPKLNGKPDVLRLKKELEASKQAEKKGGEKKEAGGKGATKKEAEKKEAGK